MLHFKLNFIHIVANTLEFQLDSAKYTNVPHRVIKNLNNVYHSINDLKLIKSRRMAFGIGKWNASAPPITVTEPESKSAQKLWKRHEKSREHSKFIRSSPFILGEVVAYAEDTTGLLLGKLNRPINHNHINTTKNKIK